MYKHRCNGMPYIYTGRQFDYNYILNGIRVVWLHLNAWHDQTSDIYLLIRSPKCIDLLNEIWWCMGRHSLLLVFWNLNALFRGKLRLMTLSSWTQCFMHLRAKLFRGSVNMFLNLFPHWHDTGCWKPSSCKSKTYLFYTVNIKGADALASCVAWASASLISTMLNPINSVPACFNCNPISRMDLTATNRD